jgi:aconitate hydratase
MAFDIEMIKKVYENMSRVDKAREIVGHPLTLTEKILYNHLWMVCHLKFSREELIMLIFSPDRVACQDATVGFVAFMHAGKLR